MHNFKITEVFFLKKLFSLFLIISFIFLVSCSSDREVDIYDFADRFSAFSEEFKIDTKALTAEEENDTLCFPFTFSDKFLLTVKADEKTSFITSCSVVFMFEKKNEFSDNDFNSFKNIVSNTVNAFLNTDENENILEELNVKKKSDLLKINRQNLIKGFYAYTLVSNDVGIYFSIVKIK